MIVKVFDDWKSWIHTLVGFIASFNFGWLFIVSILYFGYELLTSKNNSELVGDILEFCFGAFLWSFASGGWHLLTSLLG
jgi:hypothetical protein